MTPFLALPVGSKRNSSWLLLFVLLLTQCPVTSFAASLSFNGGAGLWGGSATNFSLAISLDGDTNVTALQFDVRFDTNVVAVGTPTRGEALGSQVLAFNAIAPDRQRVLIYSLTNGPLAKGVVARIPVTLSAAARPEAIQLDFEGTALCTVAGNGVMTTNVPGWIVFKSASFGAQGDLNLFLGAIAGQPRVVQGSTNLIHWVNLATNQPAGPVIQFRDTNASGFQMRFYRAVPVP